MAEIFFSKLPPRPRRTRRPGPGATGSGPGQRANGRLRLPTLRFRTAASDGLGLLENRLHPFLVLDIPPHRLANPFLELVRRRPAEFLLNLARVDRVAAVVARAVLHERNQLPRVAAGLWRELVDE